MAADVHLPGRQMLENEAYLISRGVRAAALLGHCPAGALPAATETRIRTLLYAGAGPFDVIPFTITEDAGTIAYGYAAHRWAIDLLEWLLAGEGLPPRRKHEILGLLLGYSASAIARHQELSGSPNPS